MVQRSAIVAEARRWIGTPYRPQARLRGAGVDCGGLIGGVAAAVGIVTADWWDREFDPLHGGYGSQPEGQRLRAICDSYLVPIGLSEAAPGDVVLMRFDSDPQHLGIVADYAHGGLSVIHAMSRVRAVREHRLAPAWAARVVAAYAYPGATA